MTPMGWTPKDTAWTLVLVGCVLLIGLATVMLDTPPERRQSARQSPEKRLPPGTPNNVPLATGEESLDTLFARAGCLACHTIPGIAGAQGREGPKLLLGTTGPQRLADPTYRGSAGTVREYLMESILDPGAFVVPGYPDRVMPRWYGEKLSAAALEKMVTYLEGLTENGSRPAE